MMRRAGTTFAAVMLAALCAGPADGQSVLESELRVAPQFLHYRLAEPGEATISQLAIPLFVSVPLGERLTFDVGTSYASSRLTSGGTTSEIRGITDTEVRGNLTLGSDLVVLTAGLNLPTGSSSASADQLAAAGLIGNDFLAFPISNMGTGLALTGGLAVARPFGAWNVGVGGAVRRSTAYEPYDIPGSSLRFQPGNEYRARVGIDRAAGAGQVAFGLSYSAFGEDDAGGSVYNTGDRVIVQGAYSGGANGVSLAAYNVFRAPGSYASGEPAGRENIADVAAAVAFDALGARLEPSVELRHWLQSVPATSATQERSQSSMLATIGLRTRMSLGGLRVFPSAGYTLGRLATIDASGAPADAQLTGFKAQLAMRVGR